MRSTVGYPKASCALALTGFCRFPRPPQAHRLQEESTVNKTGALAGKLVLKP